ncbi:MAG: glutamate synthase-related protein, partial [Pontimonas sp.]
TVSRVEGLTKVSGADILATGEIIDQLGSVDGINTRRLGFMKLKGREQRLDVHEILNSLKHAGTPWEIGLAEAQQTLMRNNLRGRVTVQVDGQMKTGRDVIIAALLGAEEYGFATAPMVVSGCILMRVCHLDTCPVGVATQNPMLRQRFTGKPEFVKTFFEFLAEEVREYLAQLGFRSLDEAIGHVELLDVERAISHWKADGLDLSPILSAEHVTEGVASRRVEEQDHEIAQHFDNQLIRDAQPALIDGGSVSLEYDIRNTERAVGTMLGHEVTKAHGEHGLPADTISVTLRGSAGQSLGAFVPGGITLTLWGDANDYVGKGLSGGSVIVRPPGGSLFPPERNVIAGNVIGYGATSGSLFISGVVGERFLVRNSGATAVVEGVGDHALEYMTGGLAVILGETGRNLGAGMSGGTAYVWKLRTERINRDAVASGELEIGPLGSADKEILVDLLRQHERLTGSPLAARMLGDVEATVESFVKVTPRDYQAILRTREEAEREGLDPNGDEVWTRILEVTGG